jgi:hypothetical protein
MAAAENPSTTAQPAAAAGAGGGIAPATQPRIIPGLNLPLVEPKKSTRSRNKKSKATGAATGDVAAAVAHDGVATSATAPAVLSDELVAGEGELEEKKTSAVEACQKRIRSANKKIVSSYVPGH